MALRKSADPYENQSSLGFEDQTYAFDPTENPDSPENIHQTVEDEWSVETAPDPVLSQTQKLALDMEQARQQLLELLLQSTDAITLMALQANTTSDDHGFPGETSPASMVVQDYHFVQPESHFEASKFLPSLLLIITDRTLRQDDLDTVYRTQLAEYRHRLHDRRQQMINTNTGLAAMVAHRYKTTSLSFEDLMQEGIIGLIKAVDRFDPHRNIRFSTYAIFWIKQAISRLIIKQEKVVRLPIALAEKASVVFEAMRSCYLENGRWPSQAELQARCNLAIEEIKIISNYYQTTHSLDASLSEENDDLSLMSRLKQQQFSLPLNELIASNLCLYLSKAVASLPEKEATILSMRFGLKNHTEMTLQAVADRMHVTRERVRQIQNQALKKLKQQFGYDLMPFLEANDS